MLWIAFVVVHVGVGVLAWWMPNQPMGDVYLVYEPWSGCVLFGDADHCRLSGGVWQLPGVTESWVYPQLAILPMLFSWLFAWGGYTPAWAIAVSLANAGAFALLIGRGRSTGRAVAGWFWLAFIAVLGPIGMYRLDGFTVPLAIAGCLWLVGRPWLASIVLAVVTWMKVWPAAILAAAFVAVRRRGVILGGAVVVSAATVGAVVLLGGSAHLFGFVGDQTTRSLQIEAPVSAFYMWRAVLGLPGSQVLYDPDLLTFYVTGPDVDPLITAMTPVLVLAVASVAVLGGVKAWRGASFLRLFPPLALALVLAFIVFNKVGSPQYYAWIAAPLVFGLVVDRRRWWKPAVLGLAIAAFTQLVYPIVYWGILIALPFPVLVLTIRNALGVVLFVWAVVALARVPARHARAARRSSAAPLTPAARAD